MDDHVQHSIEDGELSEATPPPQSPPTFHKKAARSARSGEIWKDHHLQKAKARAAKKGSHEAVQRVPSEITELTEAAPPYTGNREDTDAVCNPPPTTLTTYLTVLRRRQT